jgi:mRNA interferase RelE/StbE
MVGEWTGYHRIRVGNLRIIFWYDQSNELIYVDHIGPRGDAYK